MKISTSGIIGIEGPDAVCRLVAVCEGFAPDHGPIIRRARTAQVSRNSINTIKTTITCQLYAASGPLRQRSRM